MITNESRVVVTDNSGAKSALVIRVLKGSNGKYATVGDVVVVTIKKALPHSNIQKGKVMKGVVVRTRKEIKRKDGTYVRFGDNAIVLIHKNEKGNIVPIGKRVFGPVAREVREKGYKNIATLAEEVI